MRSCSAHARAGISRWWRKCTKWTPRARKRAREAEARRRRIEAVKDRYRTRDNELFDSARAEAEQTVARWLDDMLRRT